MSTPGYGCALGDDTHQVTWLVTHLKPASTISLCEDDFAIGLIHLIATDLGTDPERLYDAIKKHVDREAARQAKADARAAVADPHDHDHATHPEDQDGPEGDHRLPGREDEYDADGRPISADLT